jgi:tRNA pseudouridine38-40 synthase
MVGTLLDINEGRIPLEELDDIIASGNRLRAGKTAMAHGLYLNRVFYRSDE